MGHLTMSAKERDRSKVLERVGRGELTLKEAAEMTGVSYRQMKRLKKRFEKDGDQGFVHQGRGKAGNRGHKEELKKRVLEKYKERYPDFGPTLAAEKLEKEGDLVNAETLRQWLIKEGLWQRKRKRSAHRSQRERRAHFGELVQMDGSHHRWFEERGEKCCLMNLVDDATGRTLSIFAKEETTEAAMRLLKMWIEKYGIPTALYVDRKNVYVPDERVEEKARQEGREHYTQFGRACAALGIKVIKAYSPQAKGRVERSHAVYQDRLVKELRLLGINSIEKANELLTGGFADDLNRRFAVEARESAEFHRNSNGYDLDAIFCIEEERSLSEDWIVRYNNSYYQLDRKSKTPPTVRSVKIRHYLNGEMHISYRNQESTYVKLDQLPPKESKKSETTGVRQPRHKPGPNHPWR